MNNLARYLLTSVLSLQCLTSEAPADPNNNSLLYSVTTDKGATSHVFGTIHLSDSLVFMQRDTVLSVLDNSRAFYAEIDLDSMASGVNPMMMMLPAGQTLSDLYTPEEYAQIDSVLKERLGPMAIAAVRMKPAAVAAMLMMDFDEAPSLSANMLSVDQFLWQRAKDQNIPSGGLERIEEQLAVLDSMPPKFLLEAVQDLDGGDSLLVFLSEAYAAENLQAISELVDSVSAVESFMTTLNDERNMKMARRLKDDLEQGGVFVAIGSAHLAGPHGMLKLLREQGYTVQPVLGGNRVQWLDQPKKP